MTVTIQSAEFMTMLEECRMGPSQRVRFPDARCSLGPGKTKRFHVYLMADVARFPWTIEAVMVSTWN